MFRMLVNNNPAIFFSFSNSLDPGAKVISVNVKNVRTGLNEPNTLL